MKNLPWRAVIAEGMAAFFNTLLEDVIALADVPYPVSVEAKRVFHSINYLEGKAPDWTTQEAVLYNQSLSETGLAPLGLPVREVAQDGSAAWTLRREIYFLFIGLPFAGLTDFLQRMASETGPIRTTSDPDFRFELRPIVMPGGFEMLTESVALWDTARTTRSFVNFSLVKGEKNIPSVQDIIENDKNSEVLLARAEEISAGVIGEIEQMFMRATGGVTL